MEEQRISFKLAKLAEEKGFDIIQTYGMESSLYKKDGTPTYYANYGFMYSGLSDGYISAPTQSFLQKWLREIHNIDIDINHWNKQPMVDRLGKREIWDNAYQGFINGKDCHPYAKTYEGALEIALEEALNQIKI